VINRGLSSGVLEIFFAGAGTVGTDHFLVKPDFKEQLIWQDPVPAVDHELIGEADIGAVKAKDPRVRSLDVAACLDCLGGAAVRPRLR
jgi:hypothetical protein